jgi:hypothetical protein
MRTAIAVAVTGDAAVVAHRTTFLGFSVHNNTASANTVVLYDNASAASGTIIATVDLVATVGHEWIAVPGGVQCVNGLYLDSTGAITGSVWVG